MLKGEHMAGERKIQPVGLLNQPSAVRSLELGDVRLTYAIDGVMGMIAARFFPDVPAAYWSAHPEAVDARGRVIMPVGGLVVESDARTLVIDAGLGTIAGDVQMGDVVVGTANSGALPEVLAALGHAPTDIETVAFTHLHVDHTGWAFVPGNDGRPRKFFPNARYLVAADEWAPHARGALIPGAPSRSAVIEPLVGIHTSIANGEEIFPGVRALVTPGHSPGHTSYVISSSAGRIIVFGDAFHIPAQLAHPDWPSRPDIDGEAVLTARRTLITELALPDTYGFSYHFGDQAFGRIVRDAEGLSAWEPIPAVPLLETPRLLPSLGTR
jgi:glyoxylase-like metal-dependent hydrolase (beta-lactamase superfamily II)